MNPAECCCHALIRMQMFVSLLMQNFPKQLLGQVCQKKGELLLLFFPKMSAHCQCSYSVVTSARDFQVLDKYGDIYGRERIAELLGMDLASLDVSAMTHEKKPEPDTSMFSWYVLCYTHFA